MRLQKMDVYNSLQFVFAKMKQYFASPAYLSPFQILYCYCGDHLMWRFPQKAYCGPKVYCKPTGDRVYSLRWSALCTAAHSAAQVWQTTRLRTHYWWKTTFTVHYPLYILFIFMEYYRRQLVHWFPRGQECDQQCPHCPPGAGLLGWSHYIAL